MTHRGADHTPVTPIHLTDSDNATGYAQLVEETAEIYNSAGVPTSKMRIQYTIGDDILTQATDSGAGLHLLYDGHGSTRQLADYDATNVVVDCFSYDAYGVMLGGNPAPEAHLLRTCSVPANTPTMTCSSIICVSGPL